MLSFSPNRFFNELERTTKYSQDTLRHAYWRGKTHGLIEENKKIARLTKPGLKVIQPFLAQKLKEASLMVIFDIPEHSSGKRRQFRDLLKEWQFRQVQRSVWTSHYDHRESLEQAIEELNLEGYVEIYECNRLFLDS